MTTEPCALKERNYYVNRCRTCPATPDKICYATKQDLIEHIEVFYNLFGIGICKPNDSGIDLEQEIISQEEMEELDSWDFKEFGMGF